jgi:hypothetical protein
MWADQHRDWLETRITGEPLHGYESPTRAKEMFDEKIPFMGINQGDPLHLHLRANAGGGAGE